MRTLVAFAVSLLQCLLALFWSREKQVIVELVTYPLLMALV
jgi:hypothetical protein